MKYLHFFGLLIGMFVFCGSCVAPALTQQEIQLIQQYQSEKSMKVYLITDKQDSLLLRTSSQKMNYKKDEKWIRQFANEMYKTVTDSSHSGVGIAAPQVGLLRQMVWVQRFDKPDFPFEFYINPKIISYSTLTQKCREGCLSIPNFSADLNVRAKQITLKYIDINGNKHKEEVKDFTAVIFQHEIDHLNGKLFIDYLTGAKP